MKYFIFLLILASCASTLQNKKEKKTVKTEVNKNKIVKTEAEWKKILTPQQYYVLRQKGTDQPSDKGYTKHFKKGTYQCRACNNKLFESDSKFESHSGWPSFDKAIEEAIEYKSDYSHGMDRVEIVCQRCDGHLGHVFNDGPVETTGKRYCVNTSAITFMPSTDGDAKKPKPTKP